MYATNIIMQNTHYEMSGPMEDEYDDLGDAPTRKSGDAGGENKSTNRHLTKKECFLYCFENPSRPKHMVVVVGNLT